MNSKKENLEALEGAPAELDNYYDYNNEITSTKTLDNKEAIKTENIDNNANQQPKTNPSEVNKFINHFMNFTTSALKDFEYPGSLQLSILDRTGRFSSQRFSPDAVELMPDVAIESSKVGRNVYIEGRTIRFDAPRNFGRGKKEDTALVLALVVDNDSDNGKGGSFFLEPSIRVETSPGNTQDWYFLEKAVPAEQGERLGKHLKSVAGGDHCTGVITQCYRFAGTVNYVNETKRVRGRVDSETKILSVGRAYSVEELENALNSSVKNIENIQPNVQRKTQTHSIEKLLSRCGNDRKSIENELSLQSAPDRSRKFHGLVARLKKFGLSCEQIITLIKNFPESCWHEKYKGRIEAEVERSFDKIKLDKYSCSDEPVTKCSSKPIIIIKGGGLADEADKAEAILLQSKIDLYQRAGEIVRPCVIETAIYQGHVTKHIVLTKVSEASLTDDLSRTVRCEKYCEKKQKTSEINPPIHLAKTILSRRGRYKFPVMAGVVSVPIVKQGGGIVFKEGYDPESRLFIGALPNMPNIPENPNWEDASHALKTLNCLLEEFPFINDASRSVGLSAVITPVCRSMVSTAPMHVATAPTPGSGKSFLVDCASLIATGSKCAVTAVPKSDDELEKRLDGSLLDGAPIICLDNVNGELAGDKLCQAIERPVIDIRRLGASDKQKIDNTATIYATGNNIILRGDLSRRAIIARLDAAMERPEQRQFNQRPDKLIIANRGVYIAACLVIVRAYEMAGRPNVLSPLASFEDWSNTIRSALVWLGCADPVETMRAIQKDDPEHQTRQLVFAILFETFRERPVTVKEMITIAQETYNTAYEDDADHSTTRKLRNPELADALSTIGGRSRDISPDILGKWLRSNKERITDGLQLLSISHSKGAKWYVRRLNSGGGIRGDQGGCFS
jgi:putative DNA primase/helicase